MSFISVLNNIYVKVILFLLPLTVFSQSKNNIQILASSNGNEIKIRWAVNSPNGWKESNAEGFVLKRVLFKKDGILVKNSNETTVLKIKSAPEVEWERIIESDDNAAIVAQALFGESFEVENENKLSSIINISDDLNQRYTFSLYAADQSFNTACLAGWGYVDKAVKKGETYIYQVSTYEDLNIESASFMISVDDYNALPQISDLIAIPDDKKIMLSWGIERLKRDYVSYNVEKSLDGVNFFPITNSNIVDLNSNESRPSNQMFFGDILESNDIDYFYRVYGINSFGERGPVSKTLVARGVPSVLIAPRISKYEIINSNEILLEWQFPVEEENNISFFEVYHNTKEGKGYQTVATNINPKNRKYLFKKATASNYLKVGVVDKQNKNLISQSILVQPIDTVPPHVPKGLKGEIDSLGVVLLSWMPNTDQDLAGYRVLRANVETEEYTDLFNETVFTTNIKDTVSLKISNAKVYYKIIAEDFRYNRSLPSEPIEIIKPVLFPPTAPIFSDYTTKDGVNTLFWINTSSDQIKKHILKRRKKGEANWKLIAEFFNNETMYSDKDVESDTLYEYLIQAQNNAGLWSSIDYSVLKITTANNIPQKVVKNIDYTVDTKLKTITLYWNYSSQNAVKEVQIYKNKKGDKPSLWKVLDVKYQSVIDKDLTLNTNYEYSFLPALVSDKPTIGEKIQINF